LHALVTSGATREHLDDVRYLTNFATGGFGAQIAETLLARGFEVDYVCGASAVLPARAAAPGDPDLDLTAPPGTFLRALEAHVASITLRRAALAGAQLDVHRVEGVTELAATLARVIGSRSPDLIVCAMAVSDYQAERNAGKRTSDAPGLVVRLTRAPKVIDTLRDLAPEAVLLGFKLLSGATDDALVEGATQLCDRARCDAVFANDLRDYVSGPRRGLLIGPGGMRLAEFPAGAPPLHERLVAVCEALLAARRAGTTSEVPA